MYWGLWCGKKEAISFAQSLCFPPFPSSLLLVFRLLASLINNSLEYKGKEGGGTVFLYFTGAVLTSLRFTFPKEKSLRLFANFLATLFEVSKIYIVAFFFSQDVSSYRYMPLIKELRL